MNSKKWRHHLNFKLQQFGTLGLTGCFFILISTFFFLLIVRPGLIDQKHKSRLIEAQKYQINEMCQSKNGISINEEEKIENFYKKFPDVTLVPEKLKEIYQAAQLNGLSLEVGEYSLLHSENDRLSRYRVALPVKGSFPSILAFMDKVLSVQSNDALESVNFKRSKVEDAIVEAKLVFILYIASKPS